MNCVASDIVGRRPGAGDVVASSPDEFGKFMRDEVSRWTRVVQKGGIKPD